MSDFLISRIEPQKKRKNRFSIFADDKFLVGVDSETLLKFGLEIGKSISPDLLLELQNNEDYISIKNSALGYLARRHHSVKEFKDKLSKKTKNDNLINLIIDEFKKYNYLNDKTFAQAFLSDEIRLKKSGPLLIKNKLLQKGVHAGIIDSLLEDNYGISDQLQNCEFLANKKFNILNKQISKADKKSRLVNYLKQKGYYWDIIKQAVESLNLGENNED